MWLLVCKLRGALAFYTLYFLPNMTDVWDVVAYENCRNKTIHDISATKRKYHTSFYRVIIWHITALNTFSAQGSLDDPGLAPGGVDHLLLGLPEAGADEAVYSIIIPDIVLLYLMRGVDTQKLKERRSGNTVMTGSILPQTRLLYAWEQGVRWVRLRASIPELSL